MHRDDVWTPGVAGYPRREAVLVLAALIASSVTLSLVVLPLSQVADPVRKAFAIDDVAFSMLLGGAFALPSMVMSVAGGWLADRVSRRRLLMAAMAVWTCGAVWGALAPDFNQLLLSRLLVAGAAGVKFPLSMTWLSDAFSPERRAKAVGILFVVLNVGPAIGASIGGLVLQASESGWFAAIPWLGTLPPWRIDLLVLALANLLVLPWLALLRDSRHDPNIEVSRHDVHSSGTAHFPFKFFAALVFGTALLSIADTANLGWLPTVLRREHGLNAAQVGFAFGLIATSAGLVGSLLGGVVGDWAYARRGSAGRLLLCSVACLVCAPFLVAFAWANTVILVVSLIVSGILSVMAITVGYVAIQALLPARRRGVGTGAASAINTLAGASAPTLAAFVAAHGLTGSTLGTGVACVTVMAFLLASAVYALLARAAKRKALVSG